MEELIYELHILLLFNQVLKSSLRSALILYWPGVHYGCLNSWQSSDLSFHRCWGYRYEPPHLATFSFSKSIFYVYFACMYVYYHMHVCTQVGQKRMLDPSELFL